VISGPGAGAEVTAAGLLNDIGALANVKGAHDRHAAGVT
jgi:homoserine dehydrogenase